VERLEGPCLPHRVVTSEEQLPFAADRVAHVLEPEPVGVRPVERDPLDVAVSILDARRRYYDDPDTWWSYVPVEYPALRDLDHWHQIAGQIHFLRAHFARELTRVDPACVVTVGYRQVCEQPAAVLELVRDRARGLGHTIDLREAPPASFPFRTHLDRCEDRSRFAELLAGFGR